jgi:sulfatase modifying factor 1
MILIPAGEFLMGGDAADNQKPPHRVYQDAFYIARFLTTNSEYKIYAQATGTRLPEHWINGQIPQGKENHPVVYVSWAEAVAYAQWAGKRLPTEAEWEKAARGADGRTYPWGNKHDDSRANAHSRDTTPVNKYSPQGDSPYGLADMAGNVLQWCADWYSPTYYQESPSRNPPGPASGDQRVARGGAWAYMVPMPCFMRRSAPPTNRAQGLGFRLAASA